MSGAESSAYPLPWDRVERWSLRVPGGLADDVDALVDAGEYPNRSEAVRSALEQLVTDGDAQ